MILLWKTFLPKLAIIFATLWIGRPDIVDDLELICARETRCNVDIKEHKIDAHISNSEWYGQVKLGHLNSKCQKRKAGGWATHGLFGLSVGAHHKYMPPCYQPQDFDNPFISALVAARKYVRKCWRMNYKRGWCHIKSIARRDNLKSPNAKKQKKLKKPKNWYEFWFF